MIWQLATACMLPSAAAVCDVLGFSCSIYMNCLHAMEFGFCCVFFVEFLCYVLVRYSRLSQLVCQEGIRSSGWFTVVAVSAAAVEARIWIGWNKFRQLEPLLANKDVSLIMRGRLYSSSVQSHMLHGSETWPVRKENEMALQRADMRMVRWMCVIS